MLRKLRNLFGFAKITGNVSWKRIRTQCTSIYPPRAHISNASQIHDCYRFQREMRAPEATTQTLISLAPGHEIIQVVQVNIPNLIFHSHH
jgi:hypothetical protein